MRHRNVRAVALVTLSPLISRCQSKPEDLGFTAMHIRGKTGEINFYVAAKPDEALARKPLFVFLQGSQARPIFRIKKIPQGIARETTLLAEPRWVSEKYHFVVLGKRGMPFLADESFQTPKEYYQWSSLENRSSDVNDVIKYLRRMPWVDRSRILVVGHSQGADVAARVAATNRFVTHVACLAGGGLTQMYDFVVNQHKKVLRGQLSAEEAQAKIEELSVQYRQIYENPSTDKIWQGESYAHWRSFFQPIVDSLVKVKIPIFVANGTDDTAAPIESADIIPLEFIRLGKTNLTYRVYLGAGHGFGKADKQRELIDTILKWVEDNAGQKSSQIATPCPPPALKWACGPGGGGAHLGVNGHAVEMS